PLDPDAPTLLSSAPEGRQCRTPVRHCRPSGAQHPSATFPEFFHYPLVLRPSRPYNRPRLLSRGGGRPPAPLAPPASAHTAPHPHTGGAPPAEPPPPRPSPPPPP